ncbi:rab11 family-interacting protein 1-like [Carassius auratus]|uniref:Rab11 family-interacting protein 1-like n=1 Tax=Carassius auratus TaxID=7957 RepID=A0A6P6QAE2_CARAU|nr:rab11 family-interacting protein 1-like [Carassius auratus]
MSLAVQSQQWFPTSVQVTVLQARGLRSKGKNGTNDAYAIMQVAKDKFSTSVQEKSVAPVWKEEAAFDLPLFHPSNAERCTLQVCVMHRALMGPDKMLGQATINLLELQDNKSRDKTEWFKLMGKTGKADKERGEVLLDIQFMKNNMTASMYDLSGPDKSRSRLGKIKDKLKGKKKDGMSDSASAIVPSVGRVLTDSEGEEEPGATSGAKKKNKLKSLFAPKPGLHRNLSQSMSTLGTLPEKDSAISLSRSSGLNIESPEGKKKFNFLKHKRTGSSDSKVSQGTGSLGLGIAQSNTCINGNHVYTENPETRGSRAGSTFSLNSSGHGSMEDLRRGHDRKTSSTSMDSSDQPQENAVEEMHRRQVEERRPAKEEERKPEEERKSIEREEERKRIEIEKERKLMEREEEKRKLEKQKEDKRRRIEEEERMRLENEKLQKEKETRKLEMDRRRAEEEERLQKEKEKMEAEKNKKRKEEEEKRLSEERKSKEQERVRQEKEKLELANKRIEEQVRRKAEEEEEKKKLKEKEDQERIRLEKEEMERQKKEKEQQPKVKPRSARLNMSKKASDQILFTSPFEDPLSFDESSTNPFEQPTVSQPEVLSQSTKVSAVKPRPHAVKPLNTTDKQPDLRETQDASRSAKITDDMQVKIKAPEAKGMGLFSQLTHEEIINLLEKQKQQLSQKDAKIGELEQYIDNLLVRVMEVNPNILMSLSMMKKSV